MSGSNMKSTVNYAKFRNKQRYNDEMENFQQQQQNTETKQILGDEDYDNIFAHMDRDNLNYIKNQIKQKQKKKNHQRAKSSVPQPENDFPKQQRKTYRDINHSRENRISQLEPNQEQTERLSSNNQDRIVQFDPSSKFLKPEEEILYINDQQQQQQEQFSESHFINFLSHYIQNLKKPIKNRKIKGSSVFLKQTLSKQRVQKQNIYNEQMIKKRLYAIQKNYEKQKRDNAFLAKQLQTYKRNEQNDQQNIMKLKEKNHFLLKEIELLKLRCKQLQKVNQVKQLKFHKKNGTYDYYNFGSPYQDLYDNSKFEKNKQRERERGYSRKSSSQNSLEKLQQQYNQHMRINAQVFKKAQSSFYVKK